VSDFYLLVCNPREKEGSRDNADRG
jgi:hypothetical protein